MFISFTYVNIHLELSRNIMTTFSNLPKKRQTKQSFLYVSCCLVAHSATIQIVLFFCLIRPPTLWSWGLFTLSKAVNHRNEAAIFVALIFHPGVIVTADLQGSARSLMRDFGWVWPTRLGGMLPDCGRDKNGVFECRNCVTVNPNIAVSVFIGPFFCCLICFCLCFCSLPCLADVFLFQKAVVTSIFLSLLTLFLSAGV